MASHFRTLQIADIRRETADCVSVAFQIPAALAGEFQFIQGQNITVKTSIGGEEIRRSYSICSSPLENELRIAVKKVPGGLFSTFANETLRTGDSLEVLPPSGKFYTPLDPGRSRNYLAFAAGSGITPILSLLKTILATETDSSFTLVYGNRHKPSIIFKEELEALKNRYMSRLSIHHIMSRENTDTPLYQGRIDTAKCGELFEKLIELRRMDEIFLCGPSAMIFALKEWLEGKGFSSRNIHFELFNTQPIAAENIRSVFQGETSPLAGKTSQVTVILDGTSYNFQLPFNGDAILDAALGQGADLPYACKGGVCCTCRARLLEGKVEMDLNYALEADEMEAGFILTCQSHPRSERIVIDFDSK